MSKENNVKNKKRKNVCKICGNNIFDEGNELAVCIKTKSNQAVCLKCAYEVEYALEILYDEDYIESNKDKTEKKETLPKVSYKFSHEHFPDKKYIIEELKKSIIGQDGSIERIVKMLYRNYKSENKELKRCPLLIGKSGVGKTEIIKQFCKLIQVPYVIENARDFSEVGYTGRDPNEMFTDLFKQCGENKEITEQSIIVIDEIDKLRQSSGSERDVSGSGVIETLLSYLSGIKVPIKDNYNNVRLYISTENIKFIFLGAFEDDGSSDSIYEIRKKRIENKSGIGFCSSNTKNEFFNTEFISDDLKNYGFSRQFTGRVKIVELNDLKKEDYLNIIFNSKISIFRAYEREFDSYGVKMEYSDTLINKIVEHAIKQKEGARGIADACDDAFLKALEELEVVDKEYTKVIFSDDILEDNKKYHFE